MDKILEQLGDFFAGNFPVLLAALAILVVGWIGALILRAVVRGLLRKTKFDDKIAEAILGKERAATVDSAAWTGKAVFWIVMAFVFLAFLQALGLTIASGPIAGFLNGIFAFAPQLLGAGLLLLVAWIVAALLRKLVRAGLDKAGFDRRVSGEAGVDADKVPLSKTISETVYWLILLLFLPAILGALALEGLMEPVQAMFDKFLGFLPNLFSAGIILAVGWFVARIVQRVVASLLAAAGADRLSERVGLDKALGTRPLSSVLGLIVYVLILIPVSVAALNALQLEAITGPASAMLSMILEAIPALFGAALILGVSFVIGRFVAQLVSNLLAGVGFDLIFVRLGLAKAEPAEGARKPSDLAGVLVLFGVLLFATIEAADLLGFATFAAMVGEFTGLVGHVLLGLVIFGVGLWLAKIAAGAIAGASVAHARLLATAARVAILALFGAMGLRQMGIANEIINLGFGLMLGAVAVAIALAFGLGGREVAGKLLEEWRMKAKQKK